MSTCVFFSFILLLESENSNSSIFLENSQSFFLQLLPLPYSIIPLWRYLKKKKDYLPLPITSQPRFYLIFLFISILHLRKIFKYFSLQILFSNVSALLFYLPKFLSSSNIFLFKFYLNSFSNLPNLFTTLLHLQPSFTFLTKICLILVSISKLCRSDCAVCCFCQPLFLVICVFLYFVIFSYGFLNFLGLYV